LFKVAAIRDAWSRDPTSDAWPVLLEQALEQQQALGRAVERAFYEQGLDTRTDPLFSHLNRWGSSFRITQYLNPDIRADITAESVLGRVRERLPSVYHSWSAVEQAQYLEVTYFLSTALLASQCDRPYMAHSIEARYPFLDEDVVDFSLTLPETSKLQLLREKVVLKQAVSRWVPAEICERVKQPYTAPEGDAFRSASGQALIEQYLSPDALAHTGLFDARRVDWLVRKLRRAATSFHDDLALLWILSSQILADVYGVASES
jgi:asparagine synthase (glutamine-hydrolysing)